MNSSVPTLGDFVSLQRGTTYKSKLLDCPGPFLLGLASIERNGGFRFDNLKTYGGESPETLLLRPGDLYVSLKDVTQSGDLLGSIARVPDSISLGRLTQDTVRLRLAPDAPSASYVYWLLRTPEYRAYCRSHATGTTNLGLAREDFLAFQVPPINRVRRLIYESLDQVEGKIDQNRRTVRALYRLVRAIFRAWFVDFEPVKTKAAGATDFPSMPQPVFDAISTRFVDSDFGAVPEGWAAGRLGDLIEIHDSQRIPLSRRQREERAGPYPYYGAAGILDYVDEFLFDGVFVLVGEDGTVVGDCDRPMVQYVWGKFWVNNHAHVLTGASGYTTEHLRVLLDHVNIRPFVTGAVQPKLNQGNLKSVPAIQAPRPIVEEFGNTIAPAFQLLRLIEDESRKLAAMRDYLLSKLVSGRVRVEGAHG